MMIYMDLTNMNISMLFVLFMFVWSIEVYKSISL